MKYCKKHNQHYMNYLKKCPVCVGEKMESIPARKLYGLIKKAKKFRRLKKK